MADEKAKTQDDREKYAPMAAVAVRKQDDSASLIQASEDGNKDDDDSDDDGDDGPEMNAICAIGMLLCSTVIVSFHCDWLVEAISPVCKEYHVKEVFMATVLVPMVG